MSDSSTNPKQIAPVVNTSLPVPTIDPQGDDNFVAEFANMNLDPLRDKTFFVAVNTGERDKCKLLSSTLRGPYEFLEMVEEVGFMWEQEQHHAKVVVATKDRTKPVQFLDMKTTDYIECHYTNIIAEGILEDAIMNSAPYTHTAALISEVKVEEKPAEQKALPAPVVDPDDEDL